MSNVVYITGAPRCGKTTLANNLADKDVSILSLDAFSKACRTVFTDFKLYSDSVCIQPDINREKFLELTYMYSESFFDDFPDYTLLIEGCHFTPAEFKMKFQNSKIICLGRTKSKEEIINAVTAKGWMADLPSVTINEYAEKIYDYSLKVSKSNAEYLYFETDEIDIMKIKKFLK